MAWSECEQRFIRKVEPDLEKAKSILEMVLERGAFLKSIPVSEKSVSFVFENYYEMVKELLIALMLKKGLRSGNHQCLFTFFAREYHYEAEVNIIKQMNFLRNRLEYYGERVDYAYFMENYKNFEKIIQLLIKMVKE